MSKSKVVTKASGAQHTKEDFLINLVNGFFNWKHSGPVTILVCLILAIHICLCCYHILSIFQFIWRFCFPTFSLRCILLFLSGEVSCPSNLIGRYSTNEEIQSVEMHCMCFVWSWNHVWFYRQYMYVQCPLISSVQCMDPSRIYAKNICMS